jgi:hypothetical protein
MPSSSGMRMSMSTSSGRSSLVSLTASAAGGGFSDDFDVGLGPEDHPESGADELLVVGDHDAHGHESAPCSPRGMRAANWACW